MKPESLSLSQLNQRIKSVLSNAFTDPIWVVAEISELRVNSSGHCYMELIEKSGEHDQILAKIKATIWSFTFRMLAPYFESTTGYRLDAGLKVLLKVQPEFHEVYGLSLVIRDIDPSFTLGDIARKKQEILRKLQKDGVIDMNRLLEFPEVPQRIAIISSETAAGYGDFMDTLINNPSGFFFHTELFSALVQGEKAADSIINALERIFEREDEFDLVVIIRGGGAQSDLECFNNYNLVYHITQFPLPVISGIGHERDETITDIVAHTSVKTPTAAAELLIDKLTEFDNTLELYLDELSEMVNRKISDEKERILHLSQNTFYLVHQNLNEASRYMANSLNRLGFLTRQYSSRRNDALINYTHRIGFDCSHRFKAEFAVLDLTTTRMIKSISSSVRLKNDQLSAFEKNLEYVRPEKVLMRGYSISSSGGKLIKDVSNLKEGDELTTRFLKGTSVSIVKKTNKE